MSLNGKHPQENSESVPDGIEDVSAFLNRWREPAPDPAGATAKAALIDLLDAEMRAQRTPLLSHEKTIAQTAVPLQPTPKRMTWAWLIVRSQVRLVHPATWAASALVIALGALVTLILYRPAQSGAELPLVIVAPLVAACGVAFLYGLDADPALELQLATPISARVILLARLALLFGFNLTITLVCSVGLSLTRTGISLMPLIGAWLAPMTFLSALAFLLSVIFFDSLASVLISMLLWIGTAARHFLSVEPFFLPDVQQLRFQLPLLIIAPLLVVLALWIAEHEERWSGGVH